MENVDVIILAGGMGTRLRAAVPGVPKPLAPVGGRPFLEILLNTLKPLRFVERVVLAIGSRADQIVREFGGRAGYPFRIVFSVEEEPLGTGGAVRKALSQCASGTILVMNGDSFVDVDMQELLRAHGRSGLPATLVACRVEDAGRYGTVAADANGRVVSFEEKRPGAGSGIINAGVYVFDRRLFDGLEEGKNVSLERDLLPNWIAGGIRAHFVDGRFIDIGVPESYGKAQDYLKEHME